MKNNCQDSNDIHQKVLLFKRDELNYGINE